MTTLTSTPAPRAVFCVIDGEHRDVADAERVAAGTFTHAGLELSLGIPPDWHSPLLPTDVEWAIEWRKFYFGLDLAHAFAETGHPRFLDAWRALVRSFVEAGELGADTSDVAARRLQNWIYAWRRFADATPDPVLPATEAALLVDAVQAHVAFVRSHLSAERNHRTLELYALFVAALALPAIDASGTLLAFATDEIGRNVERDVLADGVHRERSTHYHMTVLRSLLGMIENARRFALPLPVGLRERVARACEFAMHVHTPLGSIPAISDADTGSYLDLLALAGRLLDRPEWRWVGTRGEDGTPPADGCASFPIGGYYTQRSHWHPDGQDARYLLFDCGPVGDGGHGHYDALHVEVVANGRPLLVDPGRYTYHEGTPNWRRWFKGTAAHNTVCIDHTDQTPYRRGKPRGGVAEATLILRRRTPMLDALVGEVRSPAYDAVHTRLVLFVAGAYWLVADHVLGDSPHHVDLRFHLAPDADGQVEVGRTRHGWVVRAPGLRLEGVGADTPTIEAGWAAPSYGMRLNAPVVSVAADATPTVSFVTLVAPEHPDAPAPRLVTQHGDGIATPLVVTVDGGTPETPWRDSLTWALTPFQVGAALAHAAWCRRDATGRVVARDTDPLVARANRTAA